MTYEPPNSLSPSRLSLFIQCPMKFRFETLDRFETVQGQAAMIGSAVHLAIERLYTRHEAHDRSQDAFLVEIDGVISELSRDPEFIIAFSSEKEQMDAASKIQAIALRYLHIDDPTAIEPMSVELRLEVDVDGLILRGIIDQLNRTESGGLRVRDWKSGKIPGEKYEAKAFVGMNCYSLMCELEFGQIPEELELVYVAHGKTITAYPTARTNRATRQRVNAVRKAIERSCETDDFKPNPSNLCENYCDFKPYCPAFGGQPEQAFVELTRREPSSNA